jgi:hypothetical protein
LEGAYWAGGAQRMQIRPRPLVAIGKGKCFNEGPARPRSSDPLMVKEFRKKPTNLSIKLSRWRALDAIRHGAER